MEYSKEKDGYSAEAKKEAKAMDLGHTIMTLPESDQIWLAGAINGIAAMARRQMPDEKKAG